MTLLLRYDGGFDLAFLESGERVTRAGDGTGACVIDGPDGSIRVELGDWLIRNQDGVIRVGKEKQAPTPRTWLQRASDWCAGLR